MNQVLEIVLPVFGILAMGYAAARFGHFDEAANRGLALFVFAFSLPLLLFKSVLTTGLPESIPWGYFGAYFGGTLLTMALAMAAGRWFFHRRLDELGVMALGSGFSNSSMLGIPLILTAFGEEAGFPLFMLLAVHSLFLLPIITTIIETGRGAGQSLGRTLKAILRGVASNPVILALTAGLSANLAGLHLPKMVVTVIDPLAQAAVPCALFSLGATLSRYKLTGQLGEPTVLLGFKAIVHPLIVWLLSDRVFALPPLWTAVATTLAALPSGITAYLYAHRYSAFVAGATTTILLTTVFSAISLSVLIYLFGVR